MFANQWKLIVGIFTSMLFLGCSDTSMPEPVNDEPSVEREHDDILTVLEKDFREPTIIGSKSFPNGDVAYYEFSYYTPDGILVKKAYWPGEGILSIRDAAEKYNEEYRNRHGSLSIESYIVITDGDLNELYNGVVFTSSESIEGDVYDLCTEWNWECARLESSIEIYGVDFFNVRGEEILSNAHALDENSIIKIFRSPPSSSEGEQTASPETGSGGYSGSYQGSNQEGIFGDGIKVGILEFISRRCQIYHDHMSLSNATVIYNDAATRACDPNGTQSDWDNQCNMSTPCVESGGTKAICVPGNTLLGGRCIAPHTSQVASRIATTIENVPTHAANVELNIANFAGSNTSTQSFLSRYDWFVQRKVQIVNESYTTYFDKTGYGPTKNTEIFPDPKAHIADTYARTTGMTFVIAAGNKWRESPNGEYTDSTDVFCTQLNGICVGAVNAQATYWDPTAIFPYYDDTMSEFSRWSNTYDPSSSINPETEERSKLEIERPDIVSEGQNALVMDFADTNSWTRSSGTSFAAPVVTGQVANLMRSMELQCVGQSTSAVRMRSIMRNLAYQPQQLNLSGSEFYPVPGASADSFAGVGIAKDDRNICAYFEEGGADVPSTEGSGISGHVRGGISSEVEDDDLVTGWQPAEADLINSNDEDVVLDVSTRYQPLRIESKPGYSGNIEQKKVLTLPPPKPDASGQRSEIRVSLSYYSCPNTLLPKDTAISTAVDLDLVMCAVESNGDRNCYAASQSLHDTNEGFHVVVPEEAIGKVHEVYLVKDADSDQPCRGGVEPLSVVYDMFNVNNNTLPNY